MASESIAPQVLRRISREANSLRVDPPEGVRVVVNEEDIADVRAWVAGPPGTPYQGGFFKVRFSFSHEYPAAPPKCSFVTKIFHPNVGPSGDICVNTLKKDWQSSHTLSHILVVIKCLLIYPNPESALDEEAGRLLLERYDEYASRARLVTKVHGNVGRRPVEFEIESKSEKEARLAAAKVASSSSSCCDPSPTSSVPPAPVNPLQPSSTSALNAAMFSTTSEFPPSMAPPTSFMMQGTLSTSSSGTTTSSGLSKKRSVGTALGAGAAEAAEAMAKQVGAASSAGEHQGMKLQQKKVVTGVAGGSAPAKKRGLKRL